MENSKWYEFDRQKRSIQGHQAQIVFPRRAAQGKPWIWRTEFFGHEPQVDLALLRLGFHVMYVDLQDLYGASPAMQRMETLYAFATGELGLNRRTVLEGFSRGALPTLNWAAAHPDRVCAIYFDAPVCDITSWPAGWGRGAGSVQDWEKLKRVYGIASDTDPQIQNLNPIHRLEPIAASRIPIISVCGAADTIVPFEENTRILQDRYERLGGPMQVIIKPGVDHHPHSLPDPKPIVEFILNACGSVQNQ